MKDSMAQWIRRWSTEPEILGSIPSEVVIEDVFLIYYCFAGFHAEATSPLAETRINLMSMGLRPIYVLLAFFGFLQLGLRLIIGGMAIKPGLQPRPCQWD